MEGGSHPLYAAYNIALAEFYRQRQQEELTLERNNILRKQQAKMAAEQAVRRITEDAARNGVEVEKLTCWTAEWR